MRLGYTIIYVPSVEAALQFYAQAFNLKIAFLHESKQYGELDTGNTALAFVDESLAEANGAAFTRNRLDQQAPGFEIAFTTNNVNQAYQHALTAGATGIKEPAEKPWGQTVAYVRDLNGVLVEICTPMG